MLLYKNNSIQVDQSVSESIVSAERGDAAAIEMPPIACLCFSRRARKIAQSQSNRIYHYDLRTAGDFPEIPPNMVKQQNSGSCSNSSFTCYYFPSAASV